MWAAKGLTGSCEITSRVLKPQSELKTLNLRGRVRQLQRSVKYPNPGSTPLNSLCGLSPSLGSGICMSGSFQYLDQDDKWEAASPALTCSHICPQPKPDAPTSINSSAALDVKGETEAGSAVRGPAVYTFTPREARAVCGTNHTSHIL